jgi:hypothetical protein
VAIHCGFMLEFEWQVILEVLTTVRSTSQAFRHYQLMAHLISGWKAQFLEEVATIFAKDAQNDPVLAQVADLEQ